MNATTSKSQDLSQSINIAILSAGAYYIADWVDIREIIEEDIETDFDQILPEVIIAKIKSKPVIIPKIKNLATAENDMTYGRVVKTPHGYIRMERELYFIPTDSPMACANTHTQAIYWGLITLEKDTALKWGDGWYQLEGEDPVDLMRPQETRLSSIHTESHDPSVFEKLTPEEMEKMNWFKPFNNGSARYHGEINDVIKQAQELGLIGLVEKLERIKATKPENDEAFYVAEYLLIDNIVPEDQKSYLSYNGKASFSPR